MCELENSLQKKNWSPSNLSSFALLMLLDLTGTTTALISIISGHIDLKTIRITFFWQLHWISFFYNPNVHFWGHYRKLLWRACT